MVDLLHEIEEKAFLGSEFLTWLLMHLMKDGEHFEISGVGTFDLIFDRQIVLEGEDTGAKKITITGQTVSIAPEVLSALKTGKTVSRARMRFQWNDATWDVALNGATFDFSGIRIPVPNIPEVEELFLLRMGEMQKFLDFFEKLFQHFLSIRFNGDQWRKTLKGFEDLSTWENDAL
jgi:hypothetical protein